jgi:hypothetical protein
MATSHDIEDVLTSIRRLVAADAPRSAPAPDRALVLDQARRVNDPDAPFRAIGSLPQGPAIESDVSDDLSDEDDDDEDPAEAATSGIPASVTPLPQKLRREPAAEPEFARDREEAEDAVPGSVDLADLGEAALGDEALRRLIEEVVRQELAGALGERITRNVRKLVRRELRRVLSDDGFD